MIIYKYEYLRDPFDPIINIHKGAKILSTGVQNRQIMIWAMVDPKAPLVKRLLVMYGTGHTMAKEHVDFPFVGTVFIDEFVFHIFDGGEK